MQFTKTLSNSIKKNIMKLLTKPGRYKSREFLAEGFLINQELFNSKKYKPEFVVISKESNQEIISLSKKFFSKGIEVFLAEKSDFLKLCDAQTPQPIISIVKMIEGSVEKNEPFLALDGVADPGNMGAIIRTADWFGFRNILLGKNCVDQYSPKVIRSAMGSFFHCNIIFDNNLPEFIQNNYIEFECYGATLEAKKNIEDCKPSRKFGIVIGSETMGISKNLRKNLSYEYKILGKGQAESLNASIAAGISMYHFSKYIE